MHVLIVDDVVDNATTLAALLRGNVCVDSVDVGFDGLQAIALSRKHVPDIAIIDIEMPGISGVEAGLAIKLAPHDIAPILVAMSGNPDNVQAALASGIFNHVLQKPVPWSTLRSIVELAA